MCQILHVHSLWNKLLIDNWLNNDSTYFGGTIYVERIASSAFILDLWCRTSALKSGIETSQNNCDSFISVR